MVASISCRFDVAVIGGGIAGTATAIALRILGFSVAIIERSDYERQRIDETLSPEVKAPLVALGLWNEFLELKYGQVVARLSAWGKPVLHSLANIFNPCGNGWVATRP